VAASRWAASSIRAISPQRGKCELVHKLSACFLFERLRLLEHLYRQGFKL
jgi:hypothetical protein